MLLPSLSVQLNAELIFFILAVLLIVKKIAKDGLLDKMLKGKKLGSGFYILSCLGLGVVFGSLAMLVTAGVEGKAINFWYVLKAIGNGATNAAAASIMYQFGRLVNPADYHVTLFKDEDENKG